MRRRYRETVEKPQKKRKTVRWLMSVLCRTAARDFAAETAKPRDTVIQIWMIWMTRHPIVRSNAFDMAAREGGIRRIVMRSIAAEWMKQQRDTTEAGYPSCRCAEQRF